MTTAARARCRPVATTIAVRGRDTNINTSPLHNAAMPTIRVLPEFVPVKGNEPDDAAAGAGSVTWAAVTVNAHV
jgi:hypothetical protein